MKILSIEGKELEACFQFEYKGYLVSATTIYSIHKPEVRIFLLTDSDRVNMPFSNIPEAIKWIDENSEGKVIINDNDKLYYPLNHL
jgi:hypothetical protein